MKLTDLEPRWWSASTGEHAGEQDRHGLTFLCPHCRATRLGVAFSHSPAHIEMPGTQRTEHIWQASGDDAFETITISPSIDASAGGHWHGWIRNGAVC